MSAHNASLTPLLTLRQVQSLLSSILSVPVLPISRDAPARLSKVVNVHRWVLSFFLYMLRKTDDGFWLSLALAHSLSLSHTLSGVVSTNNRRWFLSHVHKRLTTGSLSLSLSFSPFLSLSLSHSLALSLFRSLALALSFFVSSHRCTDDVFSVSGSLSLSHSHSLILILILSLSHSLWLSRPRALSLSRSLALSLSRALVLSPSPSRSSCQRLQLCEDVLAVEK